jgi:hypothetical protein
MDSIRRASQRMGSLPEMGAQIPRLRKPVAAFSTMWGVSLGLSDVAIAPSSSPRVKACLGKREFAKKKGLTRNAPRKRSGSDGGEQSRVPQRKLVWLYTEGIPNQGTEDMEMELECSHSRSSIVAQGCGLIYYKTLQVGSEALMDLKAL